LLATYYESANPDSNYYFVQKTEALSEKLNYTRGKFIAQSSLFFTVISTANYPRCIQIALNLIKIAESMNADRTYYLAAAHNSLALAEQLMGDMVASAAERAIGTSYESQSGKPDGDFYGKFLERGRAAGEKGKKDSAEYYYIHACEMVKHATHLAHFSALASAIFADYLTRSSNYALARVYYQQGITQAIYYNNVYIRIRIYRDLTRLFLKLRNLDSATYFGRLAIGIGTKYHFGDYVSTAASALSKAYDSLNNADSALKFLKISAASKDSIFGTAQLLKYQKTIAENEKKQREQEAARQRFQNEVRLYAALAAVGVFILVSGILFRNNRQKQKANAVLVQQRLEIDNQRSKAEKALDELRTTQVQLIQSEKMASLGELTAGIAHEIQNPLNFVNNFSDVNTELLSEMNDEMMKGNLEEARSIAMNVIENEQKINHHGKRADSIVKGMLQHSRSSSDAKEPVDINALADEWLRLSYQGCRAKDKQFNASLQTDFDKSIGMVNVVPQDIGRVFLNLLNNAFYAVAQKMNYSLHLINGNDEYIPRVVVSTRKLDAPSRDGGAKVRISIKDNGNGIPQKTLEKIFQPFFTTKPTGQGIGLGLSLSYDIIKAHGGEIVVDTKEGEYAEFIIELPVGN
jgi:signal transduction histidine kinase